MNPWLKILTLLIVVLVASVTAYRYGRHVEGLEKDVAFNVERSTWTQAILAGETARADDALANDKLKTDLGVKHEKEKLVIDNLRTVIAHLAASVQLPATSVPTRPSNPPDTAPGSSDGPAGGEPFSTEAEDAFDEFKRGLVEEAHYADTVVASCRVLKIWSLNEIVAAAVSE